MSEKRLVEIEIRQPFSLRCTALAHGWINLSPFHWNNEKRLISWPMRLNGTTCRIELRQSARTQLIAYIDGEGDVSGVERNIRRVLMLDWDVRGALAVAERLDAKVAVVLNMGGGRLLRGSTSFEDIVKTICTINTSWWNTQLMVQRLVGLSEVGAFPLPSEIVRLGEDELRRDASVGYRARTIIAVAELALEHDIESLDLERLQEIRGLGPYAVDHIAVLRGDYSRIPVDSEVRAYCAQHLGIADPDTRTVHEHFADWGDYRFLGYKFGRIACSLNWIGD